MKIRKDVEYINNFRQISYRNEYGCLHREDGPAYEMEGLIKEWWINGKRHREDGAAVKILGECEEYWLNGKRYDEIYNISSDEKWIKLARKILLLSP